ncbi:hypothetical protein L0B52_01620 [Suttonella sp. R2A3]|uniref:DUF58 domain-containing protein n=1 Tax=Suttonella sp. R2A3 TaxID=2908648 RepID=UPI001F329BD0|nr:DUF58 domain-containing protein [Suttonella sp. R2A3]UJF24863.1 hypothetical protein L0B52_01620 [Suttonella sp. R2A3]
MARYASVVMSNRLVNKVRNFWLRRKQSVVLVRLPTAAKMPIVPTRFGLALAFVMILLFIWSANHQLNLGYALTFLLSTLVMLSAGLSVGQLAKLQVRSLPAAPSFVGERAVFSFLISEKDGRERGGFKISNDWQQQMISGLAAGAQTQVSVAQPTFARGELSCAPLTVLTTHPAGWFVCWQWLKMRSTVLVYPKPEGCQLLPYQHSAQQGEIASGARGEDEFNYLAPYYYGAPLSRIAWKQLGRGQMLIKQFSGQANERVSLDLADTAGELEVRLSQLCRWVLDAEAQGVLYSLRLREQYFPHNRGDAHYHACLRALALY